MHQTYIFIMRKDSLKEFDNRLIQMMKPPKPKPRLSSFKRFYTRSLQKTPERIDSPNKNSNPIDDYLIDKI